MQKILVLSIVILVTLLSFASGYGGAIKGKAAQGKLVYDSFCWMCHGKYGRGDGPAGQGLAVKPADLTDYSRTSARTELMLFNWISGRKPDARLPAHSEVWTQTLSERAVWDVIAYVRTLSAPERKGSAAAGKELFNAYCWVCHGRNGRGDGPAAANLSPKPRNLTDPQFRAKTSPAQLFEGISTGAHQSTYMPMWGTSLTELQIWDLVEYIGSLPASAQKPAPPPS